MKPTITVLRKELREMFRDKRVRSSAFFGPFFLILMLVYVFGVIFGQIGKPENQKIHVVRTTNPIAAAFKQAKMNVVEVASVEEGERLIKEGKARVVLQFDDKPGPDGQQTVKEFFDPKQQLAQVSLSIVEGVVGKANKAILTETLKAKGIPVTAIETIRVVKSEVQVGAKGGAGDFIVGLLPYLIVIWAFFGGMSIVSDLVAGEKEKSTLETLLIAPVKRTQIVLGKFLALATVCLLSSLSSVVGILVVGVLKLPGSDMMFKGGTGINPSSLTVIVAVLLPTVAFFASILLAISTYAKNPREAQTYLTLVNFVVLMPAIFSQFIGFTDAANAMWVNFVPVLNTANNIRMAMLGKTDVASVLVTMAVSIVLAAVTIKLAVWLFNREQVLTRV